MGKHTEAEQLYQRALAIKEYLLGPEHPDVAMTLSNLAVLYKSLGRYADAEVLYQRALPLFEQALGPTHPHVETCLQNYARLLRHTRRRAEASALVARDCRYEETMSCRHDIYSPLRNRSGLGGFLWVGEQPQGPGIEANHPAHG